MKTPLSFLVMLLLALGSLTGCASKTTPETDYTKTYVGLVSGAVVGAGVGAVASNHQTARAIPIAVGALVGALVGGGIGMIMDEKDHKTAFTNPPAQQPNHNMVKTAELKSDSWKQSKNTVTASATQEKPSPTPNSDTKTITMNEKLTNLWHNLPSTQWFFDNGKQDV